MKNQIIELKQLEEEVVEYDSLLAEPRFLDAVGLAATKA